MGFYEFEQVKMAVMTDKLKLTNFYSTTFYELNTNKILFLQTLSSKRQMVLSVISGEIIRYLSILFHE